MVVFPRWSKGYEKGVDAYIENAFEVEGQGDEIRCPCKTCYFRNWLHGDVVKDHMIAKGFIRREEETDKISHEREDVDDEVVNDFDDNVDDLLHEAFRSGQDEDTKKIFKFVEDGQEELFPGCKNFSKLSFTIRLFLFKRDHQLSNVAFSDLLKILKAIKPDAKLPGSFNEAKNVLKVLGLDYTKIDACPNDCMLYWEEYANAECCHVCKTSRWKSEDKDETTGKVRHIPAKILRYFPIKKRLQRLFMCSKTAGLMRWHANGRPKDGLLRHPADGNAWKNFDLKYPSFAEDEGSVRLGLATDGFNPFNTMSIVHSTWPVMLSNYNIPPWASMKSEFLMLALLIPCPSSLGNNIDVYMQPLVKDLKELREENVNHHKTSQNIWKSNKGKIKNLIQV